MTPVEIQAQAAALAAKLRERYPELKQAKKERNTPLASRLRFLPLAMIEKSQPTEKKP